MNTLFAFIIIVVVALLILTRRQRNGRSLGIRPLSACNSLSNQVGEAIESGRQLQVSLGQAT
ncbi:MAG: hypothetical protein H6669_14930 [Ardenticatenaceae bacterium]|nr:hypothetical protein [Ardenticatenaceae bacterium]